MYAITPLEIVILPNGEARGSAASTPVRRRRASPRLLALLERLGYAAALEAARADVRPRRLAVEQHAYALEIRVEATLRRHHRVATVVAERRLLPTDGADLRHG